MPGAWPLTGRAEELRFVEQLLRRAGEARGVVLAGAAGVGKTRLAQEALAAAAARGATPRWVVASGSARGLPLGAFAPVLGAMDGDSTPSGLLREAADALLSGGGPSGVVVGVDDAHLLDDTSALLVHQLVLHGAATVVVTVRSGEAAPDAVSALWKDGHLDRLELQPLSGSEIAALLEAVLGGPVDSGSADRMWTLTRGNALYLRQLVDGELDAGRLHESGGLWRWSGEPAITPGLTEVIEARIGRLSPPLRDVTDLLALGEPLGASLLGRLGDPLAVEEAEARGLVTIEPDGRRLDARLAHPLYGEVRRAQMGRLRAGRLRGRIAEALAGTGARRRGDTLRRAVLAMESDLPADPLLLGDAADSAIRLFDLPLAERLARAAVHAGGGFDSQLTLAYALTWLGRGAEADRELETLAALAGDDAERAQAALVRAANAFWPLSDPGRAEEILDDAESDVVDTDARTRLTALRAAFHAFLGRPVEAIDAAATALADPDLPDLAVVLASWGELIGFGLLGRADLSERAVARGRAAAARSFDAAMLGFLQADYEFIGLRLTGDVERAERIARARRDDIADLPGMLSLYGVGLVGQAALARGRVRSAIRSLREAHAGLTGQDTNGRSFLCLLALTQALAAAGEAAPARSALDELERERHPSFVFLEPEILLARAWVCAADGAVTEAISLAHDASRLAAGRGQDTHELLALQTAVRFGDRTVADRLGELATRVDGPRAPASAAHAVALTAEDSDALCAASVQLEEMGDLLTAADAAAQAVTVHRRLGRRDSTAHAAAVRAGRLAEACEGARTPALVAATHPLPLTDREREIVTLAAQGLTNRQIADRLVVSVRTVEGHLYRAGAKLGVSDRTQFAAVLRGGD